MANTGSLVKTGYTFAGWNTAANGSGTDVAASGSETKTITEGLRLYAKWEISSNPDVSLTPSSLENLAATNVEDQEVTITCTNFANPITSVTAALYSNSACTEAFTVDPWITNIAVNDAKTKVSFSVADNDGAARQAWLKVTATDGTSTESAVLPISQKLYVAPLATMDEIFAAAGATATNVYVTFNNWVVSGVTTNGKNVYVTDGTKGLIIFDNGGSMGFSAGDILNGTVACQVVLYNGASELKGISASTEGLTVTTGGVITPVELDADGIAALSGINTGSVITISGACTEDGGKNYVAGVQLFGSMFAYDAPTAGKNYTATGVFVLFNTTKEVLPRSAADLVRIKDESGIEWGDDNAELAYGTTGTVMGLLNPHNLPVTFSSSDETVATMGATYEDLTLLKAGTTTITVIFAGNDYYEASSDSYQLTVTANPTAIDNTEAGEKAQKVMENGSLVIIKNGVRYNILGEIVK